MRRSSATAGRSPSCYCSRTVSISLPSHNVDAVDGEVPSRERPERRLEPSGRRSVPRAALACLVDDPKASLLHRKAQVLLQLEHELQQICTFRLKVAALREKVLVVVAGGALAARLRQQAPSILAHLRSRGWALEGLRFKARPQSEAAETSGRIHPRSQREAIPAEARACLRRLLPEVHDPGLKASLRSLLRRA
ncbi:MAG: DUF721 domain-containing protein [Betaproteobacteria bacterium]|nr:DUF721 domain-containing protein [Betaproteobacteria bacterium]